MMLDVAESSIGATAKLGDVATLNPRLQDKLALTDLVAFVPMSNLSAERAAVTLEEVRPYGEVAKAYTPFMDGDVLVAKITPCFENNKIGHARLSRKFAFGSTEFHVVRPKEGRADARYLMHYLRQAHVRAEGERKMTGSAGQRRVPEHFLANLDIPLPRLPEQRRIAAILDQADTLRATQRAALAHLGEMAQAIFVEMFGHPGNNVRCWKTSRVDSLCKLVNGRAFKPEEWEMEGYPIIRIQNLNDSERKYNYTGKKLPEKFWVKKEDILFSWSGTPGTSFGCFRWTGPEGWLNQHIFNVRLSEKMDGTFFIHQMNLRINELIAKAHGGVGLQHVTKPMIDEMCLIHPSIEEQNRFSLAISELTKIESRVLLSVKTLHDLFSSLQHRAFTGAL